MHGGLYIAKRKTVSNKFSQRIILHITSHLPHARSIGSGLFSANSKNPCALATDVPMRADRHFAQIRKVARLDQQTSEPHHVESLGHRLRHSRSLNDQISSAAMSKAANKI